MSTHKNLDVICVVVILCALILTVLFMNGEKLGLQKIVDEDSPYYDGTEYFSANDLNGDWTENSATTVIMLEGDTAQIRGNGAYVTAGRVFITGAGKYLLSGELTNGSVIVEAYDSSKIWLLMNGADITSQDDAALIVEKAEKVFITLLEGTENSFTGGETYSDPAIIEEHFGAIFTKEDLTINGKGSLTVTSGYRHGIEAKDDLVITGGTIKVNAAADGLRANDSMRIREADITVTAGDDGLMINQGDGYLYIESGRIYIDCGDDPINSVKTPIIEGGEIIIASDEQDAS